MTEDNQLYHNVLSDLENQPSTTFTATSSPEQNSIQYRCAVKPKISKSGLRKIQAMDAELLFLYADKIEARESKFSAIERKYVLNAVHWLRNEVNKVKTNEDTHNQRPE